jgi:hypothetical protein
VPGRSLISFTANGRSECPVRDAPRHRVLQVIGGGAYQRVSKFNSIPNESDYAAPLRGLEDIGPEPCLRKRPHNLGRISRVACRGNEQRVPSVARQALELLCKCMLEGGTNGKRICDRCVA